MDSLTYPGAQPHSGAQYGVCIASIPALGKGNDDWFISAMVLVGGGSNFNFWAKSYEDTYGLERFNVAVSTTTPDPGEFTIISGNTYMEAPIEWTEYNYDLTDYAGQDIYVAIQCVSYDAVGFMIDDLVIDPGTITSIWSIGFEDKEDWEFDFTPWTVIDVDGLTTKESSVVSFPHEGEPMAFIVGNPTTTVPPLDSLTWPAIWPHSGIQCGACFNSIPVLGKGNDDWFISAMVYVGDGANFNFWAKTYYEGPLERFNVGVSTTTPDPSEFTIISDSPYVEPPMDWTEYNYDLSDYAGQNIYVAIQCVSIDAFIFMIDDLVIDPGDIVGFGEDQVIENVTTNIYPNPASDQITIESNNIIDEVRIYNNIGQLVYSDKFNNDQVIVNTSDIINGMYLLQLRSGEAIEVSKLILE